ASQPGAALGPDAERRGDGFAGGGESRHLPEESQVTADRHLLAGERMRQYGREIERQRIGRVEEQQVGDVATRRGFEAAPRTRDPACVGGSDLETHELPLAPRGCGE